ncbi:hypothetical protein BV20DRAFT_522962 [Pilatotrama ljubarskyi]|nr:hypothetical protein BV20DRAFT_522962 [Pilatotrama ljubarskyi]
MYVAHLGSTGVLRRHRDGAHQTPDSYGVVIVTFTACVLLCTRGRPCRETVEACRSKDTRLPKVDHQALVL